MPSSDPASPLAPFTLGARVLIRPHPGFRRAVVGTVEGVRPGLPRTDPGAYRYAVRTTDGALVSGLDPSHLEPVGGHEAHAGPAVSAQWRPRRVTVERYAPAGVQIRLDWEGMPTKPAQPFSAGLQVPAVPPDAHRVPADVYGAVLRREIAAVFARDLSDPADLALVDGVDWAALAGLVLSLTRP